MQQQINPNRSRHSILSTRQIHFAVYNIQLFIVYSMARVCTLWLSCIPMMRFMQGSPIVPKSFQLMLITGVPGTPAVFKTWFGHVNTSWRNLPTPLIEIGLTYLEKLPVSMFPYTRRLQWDEYLPKLSSNLQLR